MWSISTKLHKEFQKRLFFRLSRCCDPSRWNVSLRSLCGAVQLTYPIPLPTSPQHSLVAHPRAMSGRQGVLHHISIKVLELL